MTSGTQKNAFGQSIGPSIGDWLPPEAPPRTAMEGRWCRVEPIDPARHAADLHKAFSDDPDDRVWTYFGYGPFDSLERYRAWMEGFCQGSDPMFFVIRPKRGDRIGRAAGTACYQRIDRRMGSIEVAHLMYSPRLQRTTAATEAMYLMMRRVFDLGYRRYEWKCDGLNETSIRAAFRLGFQPEGVFRQALIYKGRSRDTQWLSVIDKDWPRLRHRFERWLEPDNFDASGAQRTGLKDS